MTTLTKALLFSTTLLLPALNVPAAQPHLQPDSVPLDWRSGTYSYDGAGNIVRIGPGTFGKTDVHVYDAFGRLVSTSAGTASHSNTQSITYDRHGNITRIDTTSAPGGQSAVTETVTPLVNDATNRLRSDATACGGTICPTGTYDQAGNQVTSGGGVTYGYDALGMMKEASSAGGRERYIYDSNGERISTVHLTAGTQPAVISRDVTVRRTDGKVVRAFTDLIVAGSHTWKWQEDYVYRGSLLLAAVLPDGATQKRQHFHLDHLGSPRLITDDRGVRLAFHTYLPFGAEAAGSDYDTEAMKFTGHERSAPSSIATGLDYMHARHYGAAMARFLSVDPVVDSKRSVPSPQLWNRYSYVGDNPLNRTDPDGRVVRLNGPDSDRQKELELIQAELRKEDRKYVSRDFGGKIVVDPTAKGGYGLERLKQLASDKAPTVDVKLGTTYEQRDAKAPGGFVKLDIQIKAGGGATVPAGGTRSGNMEVTVDPSGSRITGFPAKEVMGHELIGHAWDFMFRGVTSEHSAVTSENILLQQQGEKAVRTVPNDVDHP